MNIRDFPLSLRPMKHLAIAALLAAAVACQREAVVTDTVAMDTREPIAIRYVGSPELPVREQANDAAPIMATYQNGEAVSVLAEKGEWVEVRSGDRTGWTRAADLTTAEGKQEAEDNPQPKFRVMPMPVSAPSAHGEIYLEADVNSDGEVTAVRTLVNTTGSAALEAQNTSALRSAKFFPIVRNNERTKFKYYHRVTY
jgi:TonB family protein